MYIETILPFLFVFLVYLSKASNSLRVDLLIVDPGFPPDSSRVSLSFSLSFFSLLKLHSTAVSVVGRLVSHTTNSEAALTIYIPSYLPLRWEY